MKMKSKHKISHLAMNAMMIVSITFGATHVCADKNLLVINASPDLEGSSRKLSQHFVEQLESRYPNQYTITYRDLAAGEIVPCLRSASFEVFKEGTASTSEAQTLKRLSDELINEIEHVDAVILASPMHNLTIPAVLKAYFDLIIRAGKTFQYTSDGPVGLLQNRPVIFMSSSGGCCSETNSDAFFWPYVRHVFNYIGLSNVSYVALEGTSMSARKKTALTEAKEKLEKHLESFHIATHGMTQDRISN